MTFIDQLEEQGQYERAAAIAVFTLRMGRAIALLNSGSKHRQDSASAAAGDAVNLNVVAMALSGYYDNKNTLWRDMCHSLYSRLQHAYLRAMFAFLTCDDDKYDDILVSVLPSSVRLVTFPLR